MWRQIYQNILIVINSSVACSPADKSVLTMFQMCTIRSTQKSLTRLSEPDWTKTEPSTDSGESEGPCDRGACGDTGRARSQLLFFNNYWNSYALYSNFALSLLNMDLLKTQK